MSEVQESDEPYLRVSSWKSWVSDFAGGPRCICVCVRLSFVFQSKALLSLACVVLEESYHLV